MTTYNDGASGAPAGTPQLPTLLSGYATLPPWKVAGVDYHVGVPAGAALLDPATIAIPGVTVNAVNHTVQVSGSNVTLSGYNFALNGGWGVSIHPGVTNTVIENSSFLLGSNNYVPINSPSGTGNLTVLNCTFNGNSTTNGTAWAMINYAGSGTFTSKYNVFENTPEDAIDFGAGSMSTIVEYNLFQNLGTSPGAHADTVQYDGTNSSNSVISFNTVTSGEEGIQLAAQGGSTLTNTTIDNNVIVAKGPALTMSDAIAVQQWSGNTINGVVVDNNYIDDSGAYGAFYPLSSAQTTYPTNVAFSDNVNLTTGAQIPNPAGSSSSNATPAATPTPTPTTTSAPTPAATPTPTPTATPAPAPTGTTYNFGSTGGTITTYGADTVQLGSGAVTVYADGTSVDVIGGAGELTLIGSSGSDTVVGGSGAVNITGNDDTLNFTMGSGDATVRAGTGKEIYTIVNGQAGGHLTISDFVAGQDSIHLSGYQGRPIANYQAVGGSINITLTDHTQITLLGATDLARRDIFS